MLTDFVRKIYVCLPKITYINLDDGFLVEVGSEFCHVQFFDVPIESLKQEWNHYQFFFDFQNLILKLEKKLKWYLVYLCKISLTSKKIKLVICTNDEWAL